MKKMRRADKAMNKEEVVDLLKRGEYGVLATIDEENQPYATPLNYVYVNEKIYFHCAVEGVKLQNIAHNSKVCFTVVGKTQVLPEDFSTVYESVMAFGKATAINGEEKIAALKDIIIKYSPDFIKEGDAYIERAKDATCVVRIDIEEATGKHRNS